MKVVNLKRLHKVWVQLYGVLEKAKLLTAKDSVVENGCGGAMERMIGNNIRGF